MRDVQYAPWSHTAGAERSAGSLRHPLDASERACHPCKPGPADEPCAPPPAFMGSCAGAARNAASNAPCPRVLKADEGIPWLHLRVGNVAPGLEHPIPRTTQNNPIGSAFAAWRRCAPLRESNPARTACREPPARQPEPVPELDLHQGRVVDSGYDAGQTTMLMERHCI